MNCTADSPVVYDHLRNEELDVESSSANGFERFPKLVNNKTRKWNTFVILCLTLSLLCNTLLAVSYWNLSVTSKSKAFKQSSPVSLSPDKTQYAGLERNIPVPFAWITDYNSGNEKEVNKLWESMSIDKGIIAISIEEAAANNLPKSQPFPWDQDKGIYLVNGFHNLHCLKNIHRSLVEFKLGLDQSRSWPHINHCVDALRQDVICNADDTPRYSTQTKGKATGIGQYCQCRDWTKLEEWTAQHTACFRFINETDNNINSLERFKFSSPGSSYTEKVKEYFGELPN